VRAIRKAGASQKERQSHCGTNKTKTFRASGPVRNRQVGGEAHFHRAAIQLAEHALHSGLVGTDLPLQGWGMILPLCSAEGTQVRMKRMRRTLLLITIILLALMVARGVASCPAKQGFGDADGHRGWDRMIGRWRMRACRTNPPAATRRTQSTRTRADNLRSGSCGRQLRHSRIRQGSLF